MNRSFYEYCMIKHPKDHIVLVYHFNIILTRKYFYASFKSWPLTLDTDDLTKKKLPGVYRAPTAEMLAYLDFSVSTTGMLAGKKNLNAPIGYIWLMQKF